MLLCSSNGFEEREDVPASLWDGGLFDVIVIVTVKAFLRGIYVGSRDDFIGMLQTMEHKNIKPIIDKVFPFKAAPDAYRYLESQKHVGKIVIKVD